MHCLVRVVTAFLSWLSFRCLSYAHWGSWSLTDRVARLKPKVHVFGHVHNSHGIVRRDETVYINAAQDENPQPIFFDIWV